MPKARGHSWRFKIGSAVNRTIAELVPVIAGAPADARTRAAWLDRLFEAHAADQIPYIEQLAEYWGELCGPRELASEWADRLINITRLALSPDKSTRGYFHGTSACLSALFTAGRYDDLIELVQNDVLWSYKRWAVKAMAAQGRGAEAIAYAERCRSPWAINATRLTPSMDGVGTWRTSSTADIIRSHASSDGYYWTPKHCK